MVGDAAPPHHVAMDDLAFGDAPTVQGERDGGERCDVAVLFAELGVADAPGLGAFFTAVGDVTDAFGGYVERRGLCAAMSVLGAPALSPPAADAALASGRALRERLAEELPGVPFSIGISVGASAAGWIQAMRRFERLVLRGPVSEARRLCALARRGGAPVLASERVLASASSSEAARWSSAGLGTSTPTERSIAGVRSTSAG